MSDINNLSDNKALEKIKDIVGDAKSCVFTTNLEQLPLSARPMYTKEVDDEGSLWFILTKQGNHYKEIQQDDRVQLFFADTGSAEFLSLYGKAELITDKERQNELWSSMDETYFEGPDDPNIAIAKVKPSDGYYWDTKNGKLISLFKMATSSISGNKDDIGEKGSLNL